MSLPSDPLAAYYDETESEDPLASYYENSEPSYQNPVDTELQSQGYEPDITEEFERMYELGDVEAAKGLLAGASLGVTKLIPGLKPGDNIAALGGEFIGSFVPISFLGNVFTKPLVSLASKSPVFQSQLSSVAQMVGMGLTGSVVGAAEEATHEGKLKMPSTEDVVAHGAIWAAIDAAVRGAGYGAKFAKSLYNAFKGVGNEAKVMNELASRVGTEFLGESEEAISQKALRVLDDLSQQKATKNIELPTKEAGKVEKLAEEQLSEANKISSDIRDRKVVKLEFDRPNQTLPEPYLPEEFNAEKIAEEAINADITESIDAFAPAYENEMQLGQRVITDIEKTNAAAEEVYNNLYEKASQGTENKFPKVKDTVESILRQIEKIDAHGLKTMPEGYQKARQQLVNLLKDLGYETVIDEAGKIVDTVEKEVINLNKAIEIKKRANKLLNYDLKQTSAQDFLKDPLLKLRQNIREGYGPKNSPERKAFEEAEKKFGENAERLKRKAVKASRFTEKPESIARLVRTPSGFADIKQVVSPEQMKQIERSLLENMQKMGEDRARAFYREMRPQFSRDAQNIAEQIIESKIPAKTPGKKELQRQKIQEMFLDDISRSSITGERPDKALKLWKTQEGQSLIKETLRDNPNKDKVIKYLTDQSFKDFTESVLNAEGKIDFKKLDQMLKDKSTMANIRLIGGEDAVQFLKQADQLSKRIEHNLDLIKNRIDKGSAKSRQELTDALRKKGKERLKKAAEKKVSKAEKTATELLSPKGAKRRKELTELAEKRGSERLKKIAEERQKNDAFRNLDDFMKSLSEGNKVLMTIFGIKLLGASGLGGAVLAGKVLEKAVKSPAIRAAFRRAASSKAESPLYFLNAMEQLSDELD